MSIEERSYWGDIKEMGNTVLESEYSIPAALTAIGLGSLSAGGAAELVELAATNDFVSIIGEGCVYLGLPAFAFGALGLAYKYINRRWLKL